MARARTAGLVVAGICVVAQALTLPSLWVRLAQAQGRPDFHGALQARMALYQGGFHLGGGVLLLGLLLAAGRALDEPGPVRRAVSLTLVPLCLAQAAWLAWALRGFAGGGWAALCLGAGGALCGAILPIASTLRLRRRGDSSTERGRVAAMYLAFVLTWVWSLAFALIEFLLGASA